jgi:Flp pilus assembly protein TadD
MRRKLSLHKEIAVPDRIGVIEAMLRKDPDDVFLHYSLGMEHVSRRQFPQAAVAFRKCVELDADYLPAHVELGKCLRSAGELAAAREAFIAAAALAERKGETHTRTYVFQQLEGLPQ